METFDAVIVGGGLSGLFCAYALSEKGLKVILLERGEFCGSKNITGGRLYLLPVKDFTPEIWSEAPLERSVVRERLSIVSDKGSINLDFFDKRFKEHMHSFTILRAKFDKWLSEKVAKKGVFVLPRYRVDRLLLEDNFIRGVEVAGERIGANVVIVADGALSILLEKAGLRKRRVKNFAIGIKEVLELDEGKINDRFNVEKGEGIAHILFGDITCGLFGGGFIYTNKDTLSIGIVVGLKNLINNKNKIEIHGLLEKFKERYEIKRLLEGAKTVEYAAHLIHEVGFSGISKLYGNGILVAGDAAGFALNMGFTVRGMEFAIASGILAAEAVVKGKEVGDFSKKTLSLYEKRLRESFVMTDLYNFRKMPVFLDDERLFKKYPYLFVDLLHDLYLFDHLPKQRLSKFLWKRFRDSKILGLQGLKKLISLRNL